MNLYDEAPDGWNEASPTGEVSSELYDTAPEGWDNGVASEDKQETKEVLGTLAAPVKGVISAVGNTLQDIDEAGRSLFSEDSFINRPIYQNGEFFPENTTPSIASNIQAAHDALPVASNIIAQGMEGGSKLVTEAIPYFTGGASGMLPMAVARSAYAGATTGKGEDPLISITGQPQVDAALTNATFEGVGGLMKLGGKAFKGRNLVEEANQNIDDALTTVNPNLKDYGDDFAVKAADELTKRGGTVTPESLNFTTSGKNVLDELEISKIPSKIEKMNNVFNKRFGIPMVENLPDLFSHTKTGINVRNSRIFNQMENELVTKAASKGATTDDIATVQSAIKSYAKGHTGNLTDSQREVLDKLKLTDDLFTLKKVKQVGNATMLDQDLTKLGLNSNSGKKLIKSLMSEKTLGQVVNSSILSIVTGGVSSKGQAAAEIAAQLARARLSSNVMKSLRGEPHTLQKVRRFLNETTDLRTGAIGQIFEGETKGKGVLSSITSEQGKPEGWDNATQDEAPEGWDNVSTSSNTAVDLIANFEGFNPKAFSDHKQTSIGYGTKAHKGETEITEAEARSRLNERVKTDREYVQGYMKDYNLNERQIDALTSFTYNLGKSGLKQLTNNRKRTLDQIINKMPMYNKASGETLPGLVQRRNAEVEYMTT